MTFSVRFIAWPDRFDYYALFQRGDLGDPGTLDVVQFFKSKGGSGRRLGINAAFLVYGFSGTRKEFQQKEREARRDQRFPSFLLLVSSYYLGINVHKVVPNDTREWTIEFVFVEGGQNAPPTNDQVEAITCFGGFSNIVSFLTNCLLLRGPRDARMTHVDQSDRLQQIVGRPLLVKVKCPKCLVNVSAKVIRAGIGSKLHCLLCKQSWC